MEIDELVSKQYWEIIDYIIDIKTGLPNSLLLQIKEELNNMIEIHVKELQEFNSQSVEGAKK